MFQWKIDEIFNDMPNVFGTVDNTLIVGYDNDGRDHDEAVQKMLQWCSKVNLKLNKDNCHFRCMTIPFLREVILRNGVHQDPRKIKAFMDMPPPNNKRELQAFLGIINYLGKISPSTAAVCDPLWKLTSSRVAWTWNASNQSLFVKATLLIKADIFMKFYHDSKPLYLETDTSGVGFGAALLQTWEGTTCQRDTVPDNTILWPIAFASKSLTSAEHRYSNIEKEALCILHRLKKFNHYCFVGDE